MGFINFTYRKKPSSLPFFCFNNKVVRIEISSPCFPLTRKLEGQIQIQEEYKKNNERSSDSKEAHEDMFSRKKDCWREQRNNNEETNVTDEINMHEKDTSFRKVQRSK